MHIIRIPTEKGTHLSWWDKIALLLGKLDIHMNILFCSPLLICLHSLIGFYLISFSPRELDQNWGLLATISSESRGQNGAELLGEGVI